MPGAKFMYDILKININLIRRKDYNKFFIVMKVSFGKLKTSGKVITQATTETVLKATAQKATFLNDFFGLTDFLLLYPGPAAPGPCPLTKKTPPSAAQYVGQTPFSPWVPGWPASPGGPAAPSVPVRPGLPLEPLGP
uniref:Uncharacterized protein n=1 Tax=Romanomermis culicivorax TaxID=13658 RepID=A0A915K4J8_ROMCU